MVSAKDAVDLPGCSTGCNISVETYQNRIARFKPRVNEAVNSHWLCDEGRYCFHDLAGGERLTTPMIRQEGGLVPTDWQTALEAVAKGLRSTQPLAGILSGRNTNEEAYLFAKLIKKLSSEAALEVVYQERELTEVQKILMSPDRSPNFRGARDMGVSDGGFDSLMQKLLAGHFSAAYVVGEDLITSAGEPETVRAALQKLSFLVVQDIRLSEDRQIGACGLAGDAFRRKRRNLHEPQGTAAKTQRGDDRTGKRDARQRNFHPITRVPRESSSVIPRRERYSRLWAGRYPATGNIDYDLIGDQGIELGGGGGGAS